MNGDGDIAEVAKVGRYGGRDLDLDLVDTIDSWRKEGRKEVMGYIYIGIYN